MILTGDCRELLRGLAAGSVHCVVTSPPYLALRDYGLPPLLWAGGWRGSLGLEPTPELYVEHMVEVFREVRRVLRDDGTVWLNMGDSYASQGGHTAHGFNAQVGNTKSDQALLGTQTVPPGLKPKDLCGIPWRLAFALQADGWWLRSDIIWHKTNPMPESVRDRPTKAHEYLFLLSKSKRYYYDQDAVREPSEDKAGIDRFRGKSGLSRNSYEQRKWTDRSDGLSRPPMTMNNRNYNPAGRNRRTVWTIPTQPFKGAHFATFPEKLVEPCILAGTSERGCCPACGKPWERVTEKTTTFEGGSGKAGRTAEEVNASGKWAGKQYGTNLKLGPVNSVKTTGWRPGCGCPGRDGDSPWPELAVHPDGEANWPTIPAIVLDPFGGSGTVGVVAKKLGRDYILMDLNPDYVSMQEQRLARVQPRLM